jgi:hypothetical protein
MSAGIGINPRSIMDKLQVERPVIRANCQSLIRFFCRSPRRGEGVGWGREMWLQAVDFFAIIVVPPCGMVEVMPGAHHKKWGEFGIVEHG